MIDRPALSAAIRRALRRSPAVALVGPRQVGKTTLARSLAPQLTPSMRTALNDLALDALYVVYPGDRRYRIGERAEMVPLASVLS